MHLRQYGHAFDGRSTRTPHPHHFALRMSNSLSQYQHFTTLAGRATDVCFSTIVPINFSMVFAFAGSLRAGTAGSGVDLLIAVIERDIVSYFFHSWNS